MLTTEREYEGFRELRKPFGKFDLYEVTVARTKGEEAIILLEIKVVASSETVIEKYIEELARKDFGGEWEWNGRAYEEIGGNRFITYECLKRGIGSIVLVD